MEQVVNDILDIRFRDKDSNFSRSTSLVVHIEYVITYKRCYELTFCYLPKDLRGLLDFWQVSRETGKRGSPEGQRYLASSDQRQRRRALLIYPTGNDWLNYSRIGMARSRTLSDARPEDVGRCAKAPLGRIFDSKPRERYCNS